MLDISTPAIQKRFSPDVTERHYKIVIVGGGIGGLTTALALAHEGHRVTVLEQHADIADVGAGIQLSPNATRCLFALGVEDALRSISHIPSHMVWLDGGTDCVIDTFSMSDDRFERYQTPYVQVFRPDLISLLNSECEQNDLIELQRGIKVAIVSPTEHQVNVTTSKGMLEADLCVGADGLNSTVRRSSNIGISSRTFAGYAYRVVIPISKLGQSFDRTATMLWLHSNFHVVAYVVGTEPVMNCVFVVESPQTKMPDDVHRQTSSRNELVDALTTPSQQIQSLLEHIPYGNLYRWPLYQFPPQRVSQRNVGNGRIVLVGDAWHTTLPFAGQGAALTIEDAIALGRHLRDWQKRSPGNQDQRSPGDHIARFESERIPRIHQVQAISARNRWVYHLKSPLLRRLRAFVAQFAFGYTTQRLFSYEEINNN